MIFVTVGTDLPFDRMIRVIDDWARVTGRSDLFAQIGEGGWAPRYMPFKEFLQPLDFSNIVQEASIIISHAGMGTILSALLHRKPILVMPKMAELGEHRNDHQVATARRMQQLRNVNVAFDENELRSRLEKLDELLLPKSVTECASNEIIDNVRKFIFDGFSKHKKL